MGTKWKFKNAAVCSVLDWQTNDKFDFIRVENDGFESLNAPVGFTRTILFIKDDYFIITDSLASQARHSFEWLAHFPPSDLQIDRDDNSVRTSFDGNNVLLIPLDGDEIESIRGHVCKANARGEITRIPYISYEKAGKSFNPHILVYPYSGAKPSVRTETIRDDGDIFVSRITSGEYIDLFFERRNLVGNFEMDGVSFDSNLLFLRRSIPDNEIERMFAR